MKPKTEHKKRSELKERKPNWQEYTATVEDIEEFLRNHVYLRHNVVTGRVECRVPDPPLTPPEREGKYTRGEDDILEWLRQETDISSPPSCTGGVGGGWFPISDRVVNTLWRTLSMTKQVRQQDIYRVIESDFSPDYHPFRYYLEHLPPWDGQDYMMELSVSVQIKAPIKRGKSDACIGSSEREVAQSKIKGSVEEQLLFAEYLKKWLVGMVAGWVDDKVVNNVILVLIGEQGSYKTTWFAHLLPPELRQYFRIKTNSSRMTKDDLLVLSQYGLVCCEELDTMRPSELNQLKAAVTMPSVDERRPYGHFTEHRRHIASFCGTGNNVQFLSDPTGNRRWLPFEVESIDAPQDHPLDYTHIYAQAYALYRQGFQYWFSREEILALGEHNRQYETPRLEDELVELFFRRPVEGEVGEYMPVSRAMQIICGNLSQHVNASRLGQAFTAQGFEFKRTKHSRGYIVVQRDAGEIKERLKILAWDNKPF